MTDLTSSVSAPRVSTRPTLIASRESTCRPRASLPLSRAASVVLPAPGLPETITSSGGQPGMAAA